jgi:hypothetical protein
MKQNKFFKLIILSFLSLLLYRPCYGAFPIKSNSTTEVVAANKVFTGTETEHTANVINSGYSFPKNSFTFPNDRYRKPNRKYNPDGKLGQTSLAFAIVGLVSILIGFSVISYDGAAVAFALYPMLLLSLLLFIPIICGTIAYFLGRESVREKERPRAPGIIGMILGYLDATYLFYIIYALIAVYSVS